MARLSDEQLKYMRDRFLMWKLPGNFNPDGGISFKKTYNEHTPYPAKHEPVGTNLFDATQAEDMIRYMVDGMPDAEAVALAVAAAYLDAALVLKECAIGPAGVYISPESLSKSSRTHASRREGRNGAPRCATELSNINAIGTVERFDG